MEALFRLMLTRPAVEQEPETAGIDLTQASTLQQAIIDSADDDDARAQAIAASVKYGKSASFIASPADTPVAERLDTLGLELDNLIEKGTVTTKEIAGAIETAFGSPVENVVETSAYKRSLDRVRDSIVAIKYARTLQNADVEGLASQMRLLDLIRRVAADEARPTDADQLQRFLRQPLVLPTPASFASVLSSAETDKARKEYVEDYRTKWKEQLTDRFNRFTRVQDAIGELGRLKAVDFVTTPAKKLGAVAPPKGQSRVELSARGLEYSAALSRGVAAQIDAGAQVAVEGAHLARPEAASGALFEAVGKATPAARPGAPTFTPEAVSSVGFFATTDAIKSLSDSTSAVLADVGIELKAVPLDAACAELCTKAASLADDLDAMTSQASRTTYKRIGGAFVAVSQTAHAGWTNYQNGLDFDHLVDLVVPPDDSVPQTRGDVAPSGVADLLVVKQQLTGYEGADFAHIENVLRGESSTREHVRRRVTEEFSFTETESTIAEERELESTSRFEMSREVSETIKEDASLTAGLSVTGKYGPVVEFSASAEGSLSRSKEAATRSASNFSQDVTERAVSKVTERTLERASLKVTNEVTETNSHSLDNSTGAAHVSGVYQWVTKVYEAQMFNYGLRTMYDFMVPEPAAALIYALAETPPTVDVEKPEDFTLTPSQISEFNYGTWVRKYRATDVTPPPDIYTTVSLDYSGGGGDSDTDYNYSAQVAVPTGYRAVHGTVGKTINTWGGNWTVDIVLGQRSKRFNDGDSWVWQTSLSDERGSVPFALNTFDVSDVAVAVEVKCQRTDHALSEWKADTHAKLTTAYQARLAEYQEAVAALEIAAGVEIEGRHPEVNLQLMKDELKKHSISIITDQHFDLFGAIVEGAGGEFPQIDVDEARDEGAYVRFFEHAFEWEHLTWVTYPYFWGRRSEWAAKIGFEDTDPLFNDFLKSGFARVSVPVRPGFEGAVDHFLAFGELWEGGPLPTVSSDLFLPIASEIAEQLDRPGDEVPEGEPWTVRVPTTLVTLRADDQLPTWYKNEDGDWVEGPEPEPV